MPRCIYCGTSIPPDIGLRCQKCNSSTPTHKAYDDEFRYSDDIEQNLARTIRSVEEESKLAARTGSETLEAYRRLFEENVSARKEFRWANQEELKAQREGRVLHMNEFMRLLQSALPPGCRAWYTEKGGMPKTLGLYVGHDGRLPTCGHEAQLNTTCPCHVCKGGGHYIGFVQVPLMQEFEELYFDQYDVPLGPKRRGWRTVLLKLVENKILTEQKAHEAFGAPPLNVISRRYREYLHFLRNRSG